MRDSGLTRAPVFLESRQEYFTARRANRCSNKLRKQHQNRSSGAPVCRAVKTEHMHCQTTEGMSWPPLGEESSAAMGNSEGGQSRIGSLDVVDR